MPLGMATSCVKVVGRTLERLVIKGNGFNILNLGETLGKEWQWSRVVTQGTLAMGGESKGGNGKV
jgi:hypothetical protein